MIRSMTAFASAEQATPWGPFAIELRSVNHRYVEIALRLPEEFRSIEPRLREKIAARISRGKIDVSLRWRREAAGGASLKLNETLASDLARISRELAKIAPD